MKKIIIFCNILLLFNLMFGFYWIYEWTQVVGDMRYGVGYGILLLINIITLLSIIGALQNKYWRPIK